MNHRNEKKDRIVIKNPSLTVEIDLKGAQLYSIRENVAGEAGAHWTGERFAVGEGLTPVQKKTENGGEIEYLWQGDPKYWADRAPNLFPYIARMTDGKYQLAGEEYQMDIHGFAKDSLFTVTGMKMDEVEFTLESSEETYRQYPYQFVLKIGYRLIGRKLEITFLVENRDGKTMYFGIGGHPGFRVPLEDGLVFEDYMLEFSKACKPERIGFSADCFVDGTTSSFPLVEDKILPLSHDLFDEDAIVLTNMAKQVTLKSKKGSRKVCVTYNDMDYLGIWHWPYTDAPYVCIEPWSSLPSRKGIVEDLAEQPGLMRLEAGKEYRNIWSVEV